MHVKAVKKGTKYYMAGIPGEKILVSEQDAIDMMGLGYDFDTTSFLLYASNLSDDFFDLSTRFAGLVLQKFMNYQAKVAIILTADTHTSRRFKEFSDEANRGQNMRFFADVTEAESWLI